MSNVENLFDINNVLKNSFLAIKNLTEEKCVELVFEMDSTVPRELRGNDVVFEQLLTKVLTFVFEYTNHDEILLSLHAPKDFLYEELISFKIINTHITKDKILAFLETGLGNDLSSLNGEIVYNEISDIHIDIPFTIGELGFRRHYRLPLKSMLQKKVLLIVESENVTQSITKMFKYFPYDVDIGFREFQLNNTDLDAYDVVIIEDKLETKVFSLKIKNLQEVKSLKYVLLGKEGIKGCCAVSACLVKPVTQESIFELIISLFNESNNTITRTTVQNENKSLNTFKDSPSKVTVPKTGDDSLQNIIENKRSEYVEILDTKKGLKNTQKMGLSYADELENFLEIFYKSDLYFRQVVNEKQTNKIKDFCIDLEKSAKIIGADSMQKFADIVSLIFVYNKLDMLPIYPGRYHIELDKLVSEIKRYLYI